MGAKSRRKGCVGEREAAKEVAEVLGVDAHRGVQYHGGPDSPDIITNLVGLHFEVKRCEALNLYAAMEQAVDDAAGDEVPIVLHRKNNRPWLAIVPFRQLCKLARILGEVVCQVHSEPAGSSPAPGKD